MKPEILEFECGRLYKAITGRRTIQAPSALYPDFNFQDARDVYRLLSRRWLQDGREDCGFKIGNANALSQRFYGFKEIVWGRVYRDAVISSTELDDKTDIVEFPLHGFKQNKLEPELVIGFNSSGLQSGSGAEDVLKAAAWIAMAAEVNLCPFWNWKFSLPDFVAMGGFQKALILGRRLQITEERVNLLAAQLADFRPELLKNGLSQERGAGKNAFGSPALCVAELARILERDAASPIIAGDLVSTGTLVNHQPFVEAGETWGIVPDGLDLPVLEVQFV